MEAVTERPEASNPKRDRLLLGAAMLVAITPMWSTAAYSIAVGTLLGAWLYARPWRRPDWRPPFLVGSAILAACLIAATAAAQDPGAAWEELRSYYPFLLLFLGADAVRSLRDQRAVGIAFLCSAGVAALGATLSLCGFFTDEEGRFRGTVGIFEYAYAMVIGWVLAAWIFLRASKRSVAAGAFALSLAFLPAIILNATRASLVAALAGAVILVVLGWSSRVRLLILFTPLVVAAPFAMSSELGTRLLLADREFNMDAPRSQRQVIWAHAWILFQEHPVIGAGLGTFSREAAALKDDARLEGYPDLQFAYRTAHSIPLHLLATSGIVGLLGFLIWISDVAKRFLRGVRVSLDGATPALLSLAVLLAFGATDMSLLNTRISGLFCLALGVSAGALRGVRAGSERQLGLRKAGDPVPLASADAPAASSTASLTALSATAP